MAADFPAPHRMLAAAYLQMGDVDASVRHLESVPSIHWEPATLACLAHAVATKGDHEQARRVLCQLDEVGKSRYVSLYHRALAVTGLGDLDAAFALLARACDERDPSLMLLTTEPRFDVLRSDARYVAVIDRIGLDLETPAHA
jgi:hypothetical protein